MRWSAVGLRKARPRPLTALAELRGGRDQLVTPSAPSAPALGAAEAETGLVDRGAELPANSLTRWQKLEHIVGWQRAEALPPLPHANREVEGPLSLWVVAATPGVIALLAWYIFDVFTWAKETSPSHYLGGRTRDKSKRRAPYPEYS